MQSIEVRRMRLVDSDLTLLKEAFDRNGSERTLEHLRWQYARGIQSRSFVRFGVAKGGHDGCPEKIAGVYAVFPVELSVGGESTPAAQSIDTMVDADFRRRGVFQLLASAVYDDLRAERIDIVYGFPNAASAPGFFGNLGWTNLDPVPFLVRPVNLRFALKQTGPFAKISGLLPNVNFPVRRFSKMLPGLVLERVKSFSAEYDELWEGFACEIGVGVKRGASYLNWRIRDNPRFSYSCIAARVSGVLRGFVCFRVAEKHDGRIGYLMDLICDDGASDISNALMGRAVDEMVTEKVDLIFAWCFNHSPNRRTFRKNGFFSLPERISPIELHFGAKVEAKPECAAARLRANWYLSYMDSDTV